VSDPQNQKFYAAETDLATTVTSLPGQAARLVWLDRWQADRMAPKGMAMHLVADAGDASINLCQPRPGRQHCRVTGAMIPKSTNC